MKYDILIDIGKRRSSNDDAAIALPEQGFFAVSDGMGGLIYGGETARETVLFLQKVVPSIMQQTTDVDREKRADICSELFMKRLADFSQRIYHAGNEHGAIYGATLACAWFIEEKIVFINIGDSRAYLLRNGELQQQSTDHNVAAMMVEAGYLSKEEAQTTSFASKLLQFIGVNPQEYAPKCVICDAQEGDIVLLCSDGLYGMLPEKEIPGYITDNFRESCKRLVGAANEAGGTDNISVILASDVKEPDSGIVLYEKRTDDADKGILKPEEIDEVIGKAQWQSKEAEKMIDADTQKTKVAGNVADVDMRKTRIAGATADADAQKTRVAGDAVDVDMQKIKAQETGSDEKTKKRIG